MSETPLPGGKKQQAIVRVTAGGAVLHFGKPFEGLSEMEDLYASNWVITQIASAAAGEALLLLEKP